MTLGTAVIVGVGPGLGLALARTFADAGHPVALLGRDAARLDSYVAALDTSEQAARGYVGDAAQPAQLRTAIHTAIADLGAPDVLIYNAAVLRPDSPTDGDDDGWAHAFAVNVLGSQGCRRDCSTGAAGRPRKSPVHRRRPRLGSLGTVRVPVRREGRPPRLRASPPRPACGTGVHATSVIITGHIGGGDERSTRPSWPRPTSTSTTSPPPTGSTELLRT